jgi:hypothetical protein
MYLYQKEKEKKFMELLFDSVRSDTILLQTLLQSNSKMSETTLGIERYFLKKDL